MKRRLNYFSCLFGCSVFFCSAVAASTQPYEMASADDSPVTTLKALFEAGLSPAQAPDLYLDRAWKPLVPHWEMARAPKPRNAGSLDTSSVAKAQNTAAINNLAAEVFRLAQNGTEWACQRFAADHFRSPKDAWYQDAAQKGYNQLPEAIPVVDAMLSICGKSLRVDSYTFNMPSDSGLVEIVSGAQEHCGLSKSEVLQSFRVQMTKQHEGFTEYLVFLSQVAQSDSPWSANGRNELQAIASGDPIRINAQEMPLMTLYGISRQCEDVKMTID